jgi:hydrogenase maturation protease
MTQAAETLVLAWGNPGRLDDGLGPALALALSEKAPRRTDIETDYQLQVERAHQVAGYRRVVFVDADRTGGEPFRMQRLGPEGGALSFTTHSVSPATVVALAHDLFDADPECWLVGIRGYEFDDFGEGLSPRARVNLEAAVDYLNSACASGRFAEIAPGTWARNPEYCEGEPCTMEST